MKYTGLSCKLCGSLFDTNRKDSVYCSEDCRENKSNYLSITSDIGHYIPCGTVGAISELTVCADLLKRGFEVFRAVSQHCSCDLVILKDHKLYRVEVRTGKKHKFWKIKGFQAADASKSDIVAVLFADGIEYKLGFADPSGEFKALS